MTRMANPPSPAWTLSCPWCDWLVLVNARGMHGNDPGSGVEVAKLGEQHAATHGRTWREFLSAREALAGDTE